ncbi:MAG TPA: hypothetical protein VKB69_09825 [Micromonosporaceae bacterium]|nr:hypothetical protein [Micromonosporaceae bacterium]
MTTKQKIVVIAVFVLLALLYVGAVANGGGSGQGDASKRPGGIVGWLGDLVGSPPDAKRADLSAPCLTANTLSFKGSCTMTVAKSDDGTRQIKLHADDAVSVGSRAAQSKDTITQDVNAGDDVTVTVDGDGGGVIFTCKDSKATCTVTLSPAEES